MKLSVHSFCAQKRECAKICSFNKNFLRSPGVKQFYALSVRSKVSFVQKFIPFQTFMRSLDLFWSSRLSCTEIFLCDLCVFKSEFVQSSFVLNKYIETSYVHVVRSSACREFPECSEHFGRSLYLHQRVCVET